jgi:hypothetical protein
LAAEEISPTLLTNKKQGNIYPPQILLLSKPSKSFIGKTINPVLII